MSVESSGPAACLLLDAGEGRLVMTVPMDLLNPAIVDIGPEGLPLSCSASGPQLGLDQPEDKFDGPLAIQLELSQLEGRISVTGTLEGTAIRQCVRCLVEYADPLLVSIYAEYLPQASVAPKSAPAEQGRRNARRGAQPVEPEEEADEEDELYWYQGDHLDLTPMLREQVILAAPMQPICREDCLGLCPQCGQNLNERRCGCPPAQAPSPFRVLRGRGPKGENA
ncbi:MAG: DUF177 domain-containing protein [Nitrospira sp.]